MSFDDNDQFQPLKIAIIGCGWIAQSKHLPASQRTNSIQVEALVDLDVELTKRLADQYNIPFYTDRYEKLFERNIDAVLIALPPDLHSNITVEFLKRGIHVLCEKPMATCTVEAQQMLMAARQGNAVLAIGHHRRGYPVNQFLKRVVDSQIYGRVERFEIQECYWFDLLQVSDFYVRRDSVGGRLLFDAGVHVLDLVNWWFGDIQDFTYNDDTSIGVEANLSLDLFMTNDVNGKVMLSRLRHLPRFMRFYTREGFIIEAPNWGMDGFLTIKSPTGEVDTIRLERSTSEPYVYQLERFAAAVLKGGEPLATGKDAFKSLAIIERCYAERQDLPVPDWELFNTEFYQQIKAGLAGRRVLVTGATGGIGGRLVERLVRVEHANVRALVRNPARAVRIARLPIEIVVGDLLDLESLRRAMDGCDIVFHCAFGSSGNEKNQSAVTVDGTRNLLEVASSLNVQRFVHVSSIAIHGIKDEGIIDETEPYDKKQPDIYGLTKGQAEALAFDFYRSRGLPVVVVRPTMVYGPFTKSWTLRVVERMLDGRFYLLGGGEGICNAIFVDDVVEGMLLAATQPDVAGQAFILNGQPVSFREFYQPLLNALGITEIQEQSISEWSRKKRWKRFVSSHMGRLLGYLGSIRAQEFYQEVPILRGSIKIIKAVTPRALQNLIWGNIQRVYKARRWPESLYGENQVRIRTSRCIYSPDKARDILGFEAKTSLKEGMACTTDWLKYMGYIPG